MPLKQQNVIARRVLFLTKQSPRKLLVLISVFALLGSTCAPHATPLPQITQESLPVNSSVEIVASTPAPASLWIGDSVPASLRGQAESWDIPTNASLRLDLSA